MGSRVMYPFFSKFLYHDNQCQVLDSYTCVLQLVKLESLAVYWNSRTELYENKEKAEILVSDKKCNKSKCHSYFLYIEG